MDKILGLLTRTIYRQLLVGFGIIIVPVLLFTVFIYYQIDHIRQYAEDLVPISGQIDHAETFALALTALENSTERYLLTGSLQYTSEIEVHLNEMQSAVEAMQQVGVDVTQAELSTLEQDFLGLENRILLLLEGGFFQLSTNAQNRYVVTLLDSMDTARESHQQLSKKTLDTLNDVSHNQQGIVADISGQFMISSILILLAVVINAQIVAGRLASPVARMARAAQRIAEGDLTQRIDIKRLDEIGLLSESFNQMAQNLQQREIERNESEKSIRESQARLVEAQKIARIGDYILDLTTGYFQWSEQTFLLNGLDPDTENPPDLERFTREIVHPDDRARITQVIEQLTQQGGALDIEYRIVWPDGTERYILTKGEATRDENGTVSGIVGTIQDVDANRRAEIERERLQRQVIAAQKEALLQLSSPVIPVLSGILVMPLMGNIDSVRAVEIMRALLDGIVRHKAQVVILDITGVEVIDTGIANYLNKTVQAARLKGAHTILTGMSDSVAETVVDLGIDWHNLETLRNLQSGLLSAIRRLALTVK